MWIFWHPIPEITGEFLGWDNIIPFCDSDKFVRYLKRLPSGNLDYKSLEDLYDNYSKKTLRDKRKPQQRDHPLAEAL
ncbi:MAG: hypothetical protein K9J30_03455 [Bacteroidales bacterium]|nr:hypothetical protein [Bacteroidales bacterium]